MSARDNALSRAFAAYAGATTGDALDAAQVRARILQSTRATKVRPRRRFSLALPLVAVLGASAAFGASQPRLRAAIATHLEKLLGRASSAPHAAVRQRQPSSVAPSPAGAATPAIAPLASDAAPSVEAMPPIPIDALPLAPPARAEPSTRLPSTPLPGTKAAATPNPTAPNEASPELSAYRTAHRTHFDGGLPAASLAAWDHYLEDFPGGSFADDARFNRALCLIRLGRHAEARTALRSFAAAPTGSYRQSEAASLLASLPAPQR